MQYRVAEHQIFPAGEGGILFGVEQGSLFSVDRETREVLTGRGAGESFELDQVSPAEREILESLRDIRMLVPAEAERRPVPSVDPAGIPLTTLVLEIAQDCNLRCRYCYAEGGSYGTATRLLDPALAREAVRRLARQTPDGEKATLILFGGEPLMNLEAVRAALEEVAAQREVWGREVAVSLTTNGTLLTPEALDLIARYRVAVAVSIDGPEEVHDANRKTAGGKGSYREVVSRLAPLLAAGAGPVAARVTLMPSQWNRVVEVFDHLRGLGFHEVGIAPASPVTREFLAGPDQEEELLQGFTTLAGRFAEQAAGGKLLPFTNLIDLLARLHQGRTKAVACGAGYGYLALDAGGDYYLCHRLTGNDDFRVGSLDDGPDPGKIRSSLQKATSGKQELCDGCWARTLCRGGCHYENHLRENTLGLPQGGSCTFIKRWLQLGIETYAELRRLGADHLVQRLGNRC